MKSIIRKCPVCGRYTLKLICPECGSKTNMIVPPRFSPEDHYGKYRRLAKKEMGLCSSSQKKV